MSEPDMAGMQTLAEAMMAAGCEIVVALSDTPGVGIFAVGDGVEIDRAVFELRGLADAIEKVDPEKDLIGKVEVEVEVEEHEHLGDRCCMKHDHHVDPHRGCILR